MNSRLVRTLLNTVIKNLKYFLIKFYSLMNFNFHNVRRLREKFLQMNEYIGPVNTLPICPLGLLRTLSLFYSLEKVINVNFYSGNKILMWYKNSGVFKFSHCNTVIYLLVVILIASKFPKGDWVNLWRPKSHKTWRYVKFKTLQGIWNKYKSFKYIWKVEIGRKPVMTYISHTYTPLPL